MLSRRIWEFTVEQAGARVEVKITETFGEGVVVDWAGQMLAQNPVELTFYGNTNPGIRRVNGFHFPVGQIPVEQSHLETIVRTYLRKEMGEEDGNLLFEKLLSALEEVGKEGSPPIPVVLKRNEG